MLQDLKYSSVSIDTANLSVLKLTGPDSADYLQRQLTNDITKLENRTGQLSCRLDRAGRIHSFFYVGKIEEEFYIVCESEQQDKIVEELDKFIIMEDIVVSKLSDSFALVAGPLASVNKDEIYFETTWANERAYFIFSSRGDDNYLEDPEHYLLRTAWPKTGLTLEGNELVNETRLNELAVDYKKGCFLGQETAAKIESRRGAAKYPCLVELISGQVFEFSGFKKIWGEFEEDGKKFALVQLTREDRVHGKILKNKESEFKVISIDQTSETAHEKAEELFLKAVELFQNREDEVALTLLDRAIKIDPTYADAYESKGAILGQLDKFEEAIKVMDELLEVDKTSVMAHTNKSLFFMKIGEIEKAEEEKSLATVANFQKLGEEAKVKKQLKEEEEKKLAEMQRREEMFKQVIEMDPVDAIANFGMADILFFRGEFEQSYDHLQTVLKENEKYSTAYSLLGKVCEKLGRKDEAVAVYEKGIGVASNQGDMMPANEMQSRLNQLRGSAH